MTVASSRGSRTRAASVIAVILLLLAMAPFGGAHALAGDKPTSPPAAGHSDFTITTTTRERGRLVSETVSGSYDMNLSTPDTSMRFRVDAPGEGVFEFVITGGQVYTKAPDEDWQIDQLPPELVGILGPAGLAFGGAAATSVDGTLAELARYGVEVRALPNETIRGIDTRHFRVEVGPAEVVALLGALAPQLASPELGLALDPEDLDDVARALSGFHFTFDIWAGANDGFPYRFSFCMGLDEDFRFEFTSDNLPLAIPVEIVAPI